MKVKKLQIVIIHGGTTFKNRTDYLNFLKTRPISLEKECNWKNDFEKKISKYADVIQPRMPNGDNAKYEDWKICFERYIPMLGNNIILIGNSLGGIFLVKYLSENKFSKKILSTYLVGAPFDNTVVGEDLVGGFTLGRDLSLVSKNSPNTNLLFSETDELVPLSHAEKYLKKLPEASIFILEDKNGHFQIEKFPEILKWLKRYKK